MALATLTAGIDRYLQVNGLRLHYREFGSPDGPPTLVLHGIMGHAREWDVLAAALSPARRVLVVDQRGHGASDWADDYRPGSMTRDIERLLELVVRGPATVIGHSMGGVVGLLLAASRPYLVERLILIDVAPGSFDTEFAAGLPPMLLAMSRQRFDDPGTAVQEWMAGNPLAREPLMRHYVEHCLVPGPGGALRWRFDGAGLTEFARSVDVTRLWDAIDSLELPVLLVHGRHSGLVSKAAAQELMRRLRQGSNAEIASGGHDLGVEQPEAVAAAVLDFLDRVPPAGRTSSTEP